MQHIQIYQIPVYKHYVQHLKNIISLYFHFIKVFFISQKNNLIQILLYLVLSKLVEKGYKTSLVDLLIRLNYNGYYDRIATSSNRRH
jgi:hypothetical protein